MLNFSDCHRITAGKGEGRSGIIRQAIKLKIISSYLMLWYLPKAQVSPAIILITRGAPDGGMLQS